MKTASKLIPIAVLAVAAAFGQNKPELTARELFYIPVKSAKAPVTAAAKSPARKAEPVVVAQNKKAPEPKTTSAPSRPEPGWGEVKLVTASYNGNKPLGLRYSLFEYVKNDNRWTSQEVGADKNFKTGDRVRIQVETNEDGFLYIIQKGTSGNWNVLFPSPDTGTNNAVTAMQAVRVPASNATFTFSGSPGTERVYLVLARKKVDAENMILELNEGKSGAAPVEQKKTAAPAPQRKSSNEPKLLAMAFSPVGSPNRMMARDLVFEKVDDDAGPEKDHSVYVVDKSGRADANFVIEVPLKHQ